MLILAGSARVAEAKAVPPRGAAKGAAKAAETGPSTAKGAKQKVWVMEQETAQLGKMTVYAGQNALLVKVGTTGGNVVCKAPDWKVVVYNTTEKVVFVSSYELFQKQELPSLIATTDYFEGRKIKPQSVNYRGVPALMVTAPTPEGTVGMMMPSWSGVGNTKAPKTLEVSVIATEAKQVPPKVLAVVKAIYRIPRFGGLPLGVFFKHSDGTNGVTLKTFKFEEKEVPSSIFNISTKGYAPAKTAETAVLSGMLDSAFSLTP